MEVPIQVAVQICSNNPNKPLCVETIPNYANGQLSAIDNGGAGLVRVFRPRSSEEDFNGNTEADAPVEYAIQHALPFGCSQEFLYQKTVQPMIRYFLEGFDISIVTYGQNCTGKTYTMYGAGKEWGIVQRAISDIFASLTNRPGCRFTINIAWIDVCGDDIHDLLRDGIIQCQTIEEVFRCLAFGMANRNTEIASHNLFTVTIEQQWITLNGLIQHRLSTASFCDLSGTERIYDVNEFNETISVPKDLSLQTLERIVTALCVPTINMLDNEKINLINQYEDTMLTKLLKDSFGGRAQTLMIFCVSPLEQDAIETIQNLQFACKAQLVRNKIIVNTFSDNNMPITNFIDPCEADLNIPKAIHYNPPVDKLNSKNNNHHQQNNNNNNNSNNNNNNQSNSHANSQWLKLVANAEGLFNKLLMNNKMLNEQDRECIEEWMYLKQECDDCLGSVGLVSSPRTLGPIQETNEPGEYSSEDGDINGDAIAQNRLAISMRKAMDSDRFTALNETDIDNESDSEQTEYLTERISELMISFSCKMNEIVDKNYDEFVQTYPKGVMNSAEDQPAALACVKAKRSNSVVMATEPSAYPTNNRRRSIQASESNSGILNNAELARLTRIADESIQNSQSSFNNTVCREMNEFLDNSDDMHPLRMAKINKARDILNEICRLRNDIEAKEKQMIELTHNIKTTQQLIDKLNSSTSSIAKAKRCFNEKENRLLLHKEKCKKMIREKNKIDQSQKDLAKIEKDLNELSKIKEVSRDSNNTIKEYGQQVEKSQKQLNTLKKDLKKDKKSLKTLETKFKHERSKMAKEEKKSTELVNYDTNLTQLDCVLKEKRMYLQQTNRESEYEESLRREIGNLRRQRDRLTEKQCKLNEKRKCDGLTEREARQILEYEVAKEVIDHAIEGKNQSICGVDMANKNALFVGNPDLMNQLSKLSEKEMRILLYKCFQKIVDLRESSRELEIQLLQLEKEFNDCKLRERSLSQKFQQFRLETEGYTLHLQKHNQSLLTQLLQKACESGVPLTSMPTEAPLLMSPSHIIHSKHRHQHAVSNEIGFNIHGFDRASQRQRHSYRLANTALIEPSDSDITEQFDPFQKQKQKNSLLKFLKHSSSNALKRGIQHPPLMLTNPPQPNPNSEGKVTVDNKHKKIFIQQNKS